MVVQKFGGTSVADAGAIDRLIAIVRAARHRDGTGPAVVVSAMSGVTDAVLSMATDARDGRLPTALDTLAALRHRHHAAAEALVPEASRGSLLPALDEDFAQLDTVVKAIASTGEASSRAMDVVAATGELLSSRLIAAALSAAGVPSEWVDARRAVVTNDDYTTARPLVEATDAAMRTHVATVVDRGEVPVLGGFVGATLDGHTTTLGRGGSDYSAALVGAGISAREIQIWTDVDGMLSADPRVVDSPRLVPELSFSEAAELAYFGAKVLHPSTILPAVEHDIPVRILNSRRPEGTGTVITAAGAAHGTPVTALACKRNLTVIDVTSSRMLMAYGFLRRVFEVFERYRTAVDVVTTSEVSVSITVDDRRQLDPIVESLRALGEVSVEGDMALVCAVGDRLRTEPEIGARVVGLLEEFPLRMISQAAARRNITVVMRDAHLREAMERLHQELFG